MGFQFYFFSVDSRVSAEPLDADSGVSDQFFGPGNSGLDVN